MQTNSIEKNITKDIILKCNPCQKKKKKDAGIPPNPPHMKKKTRVECECGPRAPCYRSVVVTD